MAVVFNVLASVDMIDTPLMNLRGKKFSTVVLYTFDESITFTTDEKVADRCKFMHKYCMCYENIELELHAEYLVWYKEGKQNIIPLTSIKWWVLE